MDGVDTENGQIPGCSSILSVGVYVDLHTAFAPMPALLISTEKNGFLGGQACDLQIRLKP